MQNPAAKNASRVANAAPDVSGLVIDTMAIGLSDMHLGAAQRGPAQRSVIDNIRIRDQFLKPHIRHRAKTLFENNVL